MADETETTGAAGGEESGGGAGAVLGSLGGSAGTLTSEGAKLAEGAGDPAGTATDKSGEAEPKDGRAPWYGKLGDPALADYVQTKGWKSVEDVVKSAREVERLAMAPDKLPLPKDGDKEGWDQVYDRLGRPKSPEGYELGKMELPEGYTPHQPLVDKMAQVAHERGLSKAQMEGLFESYVQEEFAAHQAAEAARDEKASEQTAALQKEVGPAWGAFVADAQLGAKELGLSAEEVDGVGHVIGHDKVLRVLSKIGTPLRQDSAGDTHDGGQGFRRMEPAQAQARIDELTKDEGFRKRLRAGDQAATREWDQLNEVAAAGRRTGG